MIKMIKRIMVIVGALVLVSCTTSTGSAAATTVWNKNGDTQAQTVAVNGVNSANAVGTTVTPSGPRKTGRPYVIKGVTYYPLQDVELGYQEVGVASWYGKDFHGKKTANGENYNMHDMTAAHKTLPLPTYVRVENLDNGKETVVRINDRGPFSKGRIIDLSHAAANEIDMVDTGTARVRITVLSETEDHLRTEGKDVDIQKGSFAIQIGAFSNKSNADRTAAQHRGGMVRVAEVNGRTMYRVQIHGFTTKSAAESALKQYQQEYSGAFLILE